MGKICTLILALLCVTAHGQAFFELLAIEPRVSGTTLNTSLIAYWKLDEASGTRNDSQGVNHLADNNTVASAAGKIGNAAVFEVGNSESLTVADNAALSLGADESFTLAGWFRNSADVTSFIVCKDDESSNREYGCYYSATQDKFAGYVFDAGGGYQEAVPSTVLVLDTWYFFCMRREAGTIFASINGGTEAPEACLSTRDQAAPFTIGGRGSLFFTGGIDEVGFWKKSLSSAEIAELYSAGSGETCCPFAAWPLNNRGIPCLAHWPHDLQNVAAK